MEKIKKIRFSDIVGMLEKDEMKEILGGSNGIMYTCGAGDYSQGLSPSIPMSNSPSNGWGGGKAIGSTFGGIPYNSGSSNYGGNSSGTSGSGSGNSYSSNTYGSNSYNVGWNNSNSGMTTNDPFAINRFFNFLASNNGTPSASQVGKFMDSEAVYAAKGAIPLNNVTVPNYYKGPSTVPQGVVYNNGILKISDSYYDGGGTSSGGSSSNVSVPKTSAIPIPFTKDQLTKGFNEINFTGMTRPFIEDWDPATGKYNNATRFKSDMKLNVDGASIIALYEKLSLTVYDSDSNKGQNTTIGFGHLLHPGAIKSGDIKSITFYQAVSFFATDIIETERVLNQKIENMDLTGKFNRNQYFALVDMTYNGGNSPDSILVAVLNGMKSGGIDVANKIITDSYINQNNGGLTDRRYFEAQAFVNGRSITPEQADQEL